MEIDTRLPNSVYTFSNAIISLYYLFMTASVFVVDRRCSEKLNILLMIKVVINLIIWYKIVFKLLTNKIWTALILLIYIAWVMGVIMLEYGQCSKITTIVVMINICLSIPEQIILIGVVAYDLATR
uniref:Uncharacterized protein n=1 Tax=Pithovirus LCPAC403 TaxID=2506596 RepID=A0A481ZB69_9VIRU|nr:MAG: uncharacterized protein LCPAC403_03070 [Pithovirus LCPAC403]